MVAGALFFAILGGSLAGYVGSIVFKNYQSNRKSAKAEAPLTAPAAASEA